LEVVLEMKIRKLKVYKDFDVDNLPSKRWITDEGWENETKPRISLLTC
jgi:hypothetical protein